MSLTLEQQITETRRVAAIEALSTASSKVAAAKALGITYRQLARIQSELLTMYDRDVIAKRRATARSEES